MGGFGRELLSAFLKWCVRRGVDVVIFYLRDKQNITADDITRLDETELTAWAATNGLTRCELPASWEEFRTCIPVLDWDRRRNVRMPTRLSGNFIEFAKGKVAERNDASFTVTGLLEGWGLRAHPLEFRFAPVATRLEEWMEWAPTDVAPAILLGTANTGREIVQFQKLLSKIQPPLAVLVTPSEVTGVNSANNLRTHHFWIDSSSMGDVLGGCWNVFLRTKKPLALSITPVNDTGGITLAARYETIGRTRAKTHLGEEWARRFRIP